MVLHLVRPERGYCKRGFVEDKRGQEHGYIWFDPREGTARVMQWQPCFRVLQVTFGSTRERVLQAGVLHLLCLLTLLLHLVRPERGYCKSKKFCQAIGTGSGYIWFDPREGTAR